MKCSRGLLLWQIEKRYQFRTKGAEFTRAKVNEKGGMS
jgi:hypothetical protein